MISVIPVTDLKEENTPKNLGHDLAFVVDRNDDKTYTPLWRVMVNKMNDYEHSDSL